VGSRSALASSARTMRTRAKPGADRWYAGEDRIAQEELSWPSRTSACLSARRNHPTPCGGRPASLSSNGWTFRPGSGWTCGELRRYLGLPRREVCILVERRAERREWPAGLGSAATVG
jgi:hypothetical protein